LGYTYRCARWPVAASKNCGTNEGFCRNRWENYHLSLMVLSDLTFELGDVVLYQVKIFDKVLDDLGLPPVAENPNFEIHKSSSTFGLDMSIVSSGRSTVRIDLYLEGEGLRIDIDRIPEAFVWPNRSMGDPKEVMAFIKRLLTCHVLMKYCGTHTVMCLLDSRGESVFKTTLRYHSLLGGISSVFLSRNCEEKLFWPVYEQNE
jgi:hypothetical protein